jgi:small multidrug resistance pump
MAIVAEVIATSFLRAADGFTKLAPSIVVIAGYGVAIYLLSLSLRQIPVGIAYAIWSGVGVMLIALIGWIVLDQVLDTAAAIGMGFIVVGVVIINLFSSTATH